MMDTQIRFSRSVDALLYRLRRRGRSRGTKVVLGSGSFNQNSEIDSEISSEPTRIVNDTTVELKDDPENVEKTTPGIEGSMVQEEAFMEMDSSENVDSRPIKPVALTLGSFESKIEEEPHDIQMEEIPQNQDVNSESKMNQSVEMPVITGESLVEEQAKPEVEELAENTSFQTESEMSGNEKNTQMELKNDQPVIIMESLVQAGITVIAVEKPADYVEETPKSRKQISRIDKISRLLKPDELSRRLKMANFYPALASISFVSVLIQYVFNALSSTGPDGKLFKNKTGDISDVFKTDITPAGWTFSIWGFIYAFQASWVIFSLLNICRKGPDGRPAYTSPQYLPDVLFMLNTLVSGLNIGWLISFDRQEIELAFSILLVYSLLQYVMMAVVYKRLDESSPKLVEQGRTLDIWLTRGLVLNGIAIQATWVTIATLLNFQMVLIYSGDKLASLETAGTVALAVLLVIILAFVFTDLCRLDRYSRYVITPYIVLVVALAGSISKNWDSDKENSIFSAVLLALCCLFLAVKLILSIYKHFTRPRFTTVYGKAVAESTILEEKGKP